VPALPRVNCLPVPVPTVRALAREVGTTRLTIHNAYRELQTDGLVESVVGRGTLCACAAFGPAWVSASSPTWCSPTCTDCSGPGFGDLYQKGYK